MRAKVTAGTAVRPKMQARMYSYDGRNKEQSQCQPLLRVSDGVTYLEILESIPDISCLKFRLY